MEYSRNDLLLSYDLQRSDGIHRPFGAVFLALTEIDTPFALFRIYVSQVINTIDQAFGPFHATKLLRDTPYCYRILFSLIDGLVPWRKRPIAITVLHGCTFIMWQARTLAQGEAYKLQQVHWSMRSVRTMLSATLLPVNATAIQANLSSAARVFGHKSGHHQRVIALSRSLAKQSHLRLRSCLASTSTLPRRLVIIRALMPVGNDTEVAETWDLVLKHSSACCMADRVPHRMVHL